MDTFQKLLVRWFGDRLAKPVRTRSSLRRRSELDYSGYEPRLALAGNVFASVTDGNLLLGGDDADNRVEIRVVDGAVVVNGLDGTTVNNQTSFRVATGSTVNGRVKAHFYRGNDQLILRTGVTIADALEVDGGLGDDQVGLEAATVRGSIFIGGDEGADSLALNGTTVHGGSLFAGGGGNDTFSARSARFHGSLRVVGGNGADVVDFQSTTVDGAFSAEMEKGSDSLQFTDTVFSSIAGFSMGSGNDLLRSIRSTYSGPVSVSGASGSDMVEFSGSSALPSAFRFHGGSGQDAITSPGQTPLQGNQVARSATPNGVDNQLVLARVNDPGTGIVARSNSAQQILRQVTVGQLTLTADFDDTQTLQSSGIEMTRNRNLAIKGTSLANATIDIARDGDGVFDDGTVTVGANGQFTLPGNLVSNSTNLGVNAIVVRATDSQGNSLTQNLRIYFAEGSVVRMASNRGNMDFELFDDAAPLTVANFRSYFQAYTNSIVHRSTTIQSAGLTVIQGGGFGLNGNSPIVLTETAPVTSEFSATRSNVRGTLAMALRGGNPNSGTNQWFINLSNNAAALDPQQFTVFGRVIGDGLAVADGINGLPMVNLAPSLAATLGALNEVPLQNYTVLSKLLAGTVSFTQGSRILTGTGTAFAAAENQSANGQIQVGSSTFAISRVISDTEIELTVAMSTTGSGVEVRVSPIPTSANFVSFSSISQLTFPQS